MRTFNVIFAMIIAAGVVYNTARISLAERSRELATLRVLGVTRQEVSGILLGELAVVTLAALPLGMFMGFCFVALTVYLVETDMFRIPLVVNASTYAFAATVVLVATVLSGYVVQRMLAHWSPLPDANITPYLVNRDDFIKEFQRKPSVENPEKLLGLTHSTTRDGTNYDHRIYLLSGILKPQFKEEIADWLGKQIRR